MHLPSSVPGAPERLQLSLQHARWLERPRIGEEEYTHAPAGMALSADFVCGFLLDGLVLSNAALSYLQIQPHAAWELGVRNLLARAQAPLGYAFRHRPLAALTGARTPGMQVQVAGSLASSWLAHPRSLEILDAHFTDLLGEPVIYSCPDPSVLAAIPASAPLGEWEDFVSANYGVDGGTYIVCREGFPRYWSYEERLPAMAAA